MKFPIVNFALAAAGASATLEVRLSHLGDTRVRASVTNAGTKTYNLLSKGSIFDKDPVRKLHVMNETSVAPFHGMSKQGCSHTALSQEDFMTMAAGQTVEHDLDIAELYDLDVDTYYVSTKDSIPYAAEGSTELTGATLPISGNRLQFTLDAFAHHDLKKRTTIQSDCNSEQRSAIEAANKACVKLANAAAEAAESGSEETFQSFFKDTGSECRSQVAENFRKVAEECSNTPGGATKTQCTDPQNTCGGNLLAYTYWQTLGEEITDSTTYYCPRYFNGEVLSAELTRKDQQSQGSNTLHEMTHALFATEDVTYGLENVLQLSKEQAIVNADTYTFYAIAVGVDGGSEEGSGDDSYDNSGSSDESSSSTPYFGDSNNDDSGYSSPAPSPSPSPSASSSPSPAPSADAGDSNAGSPPSYTDGSNDDSNTDAPTSGSDDSNDDGDSASSPSTGDSDDGSNSETPAPAPAPAPYADSSNEGADSSANGDSPNPDDCEEGKSNGDGNGNGGSNGGSSPSPESSESNGESNGASNKGSKGDDSNSGSFYIPWSYSTKKSGSYKLWWA